MVDVQDRMGTFNLTNTTLNGPLPEDKAAKIAKIEPKKDAKPKKRLVAAPVEGDDQKAKEDADNSIKEI